jgi:matrixin/type IX secretion system substrate protein/PKD domain-containing protein
MKSLLLGIGLFIFIAPVALSQEGTPYGNCVTQDSRYILHDNSWGCRFLKYYFVNGTTDVLNEQGAIKAAFSRWAAVTNIDFIETCNLEEADIQIAWVTDYHGDDFPFDGPACLLGADLAHAFFPPPAIDNTFKHLDFDDDEVWSLDGGPLNQWSFNQNCDKNRPDLQTVAVHEIGHILGLQHSNVDNACMEQDYEDQRRALTPDDVNGAIAKYGIRENPIEGNEITCLSTSSEFAVCHRDGLSYTWTVPWGLVITSGQGTSTVNVQKTTEGCGEGDITVTISTGCDELTFKRKLNYCCNVPPTPYHSYIIYDQNNCCYNFGVLFPNSLCYNKFHWRINGVDYYSTQPQLIVCLDPRITTYFHTGVSIINDCGESDTFWKYLIAQPFGSTNCPGRSSAEIELFPNPSHSEIHVDISSINNYKQNEYEVTIYDWHGKMKQNFRTTESSFNVDVSSYMFGLYYIQVKTANSNHYIKFVVGH